LISSPFGGSEEESDCFFHEDVPERFENDKLRGIDADNFEKEDIVGIFFSMFPFPVGISS
jgi:hypothetical protein